MLTLVEWAQQQDLSLSPIAPPPDESGRQHAAVVEHQDVAGIQVLWQVPDAAIGEATRWIKDQPATRVPLRRRVPGGPLGGPPRWRARRPRRGTRLKRST